MGPVSGARWDCALVCWAFANASRLILEGGSLLELLRTAPRQLEKLYRDALHRLEFVRARAGKHGLEERLSLFDLLFDGDRTTPAVTDTKRGGRPVSAGAGGDRTAMHGERAGARQERGWQQQQQWIALVADCFL